MYIAMEKLSQIIWYLAILSSIACESIKSDEVYVKCPDYCDCDVFENLNRATCQDQMLVDLDLGIPKEAQILDVSSNYIKELKDKAFLEHNLTGLKLLNISHNKLSNIHFNAFEGMQQLKTLDISYNAIEYFLEHWFVSLSSLEELYLRGNNLKSINKQPLISIKTLKMLDLSSCRIIHLNNDLFSMVPNLWYLDISDNYLTNLKVDIITPLKNLTKFKVENNQFNCKDRSFLSIKKYAVTNNISYLDPCVTQTHSQFEINNKPLKFQRMMVSNADFQPKSTNESIKKNLWLKMDPVSKDNNIETNSTKTNSTQTNPPPKSLFTYIVETHPWLLICLAFFYGFCIGIILMCGVNLVMRQPSLQNRDSSSSEPIYTSVRTLTDPTSTRQNNGRRFPFLNFDRYRRHPEPISNNSDDDELVMNEFFSNSTPMQPRKDYE